MCVASQCFAVSVGGSMDDMGKSASAMIHSTPGSDENP